MSKMTKKEELLTMLNASEKMAVSRNVESIATDLSESVSKSQVNQDQVAQVTQDAKSKTLKFMERMCEVLGYDKDEMMKVAEVTLSAILEESGLTM